MTKPIAASEPVRDGLCDVGGAKLHYEVRGRGPTLLFIAGASGDGGSFDIVSGRLADAFTVVSYDRRAHSRSPVPERWSATSVDEQADDAAALLNALGLAPANVFGTSSGATITLNLALRHPHVVRSAILHEPPKIGVLPERDRLLAELRARVQAARLRGGYREAMADFIGWLSGPRGGEPDSEANRVMERILGNGEVWIERELGIVDRYDPSRALIESVRVPITVAVGSEGGTELHQQLLERYAETLRRLADHVGGRLRRMSGAHVPYRTHPERFVDELRGLLDELQKIRA